MPSQLASSTPLFFDLQIYLHVIIVGTSLPPYQRGGGGVGTFKNLKREGVNVEMGEGGVPLFYYFTVQSHLLSVAGK